MHLLATALAVSTTLAHSAIAIPTTPFNNDDAAAAPHAITPEQARTLVDLITKVHDTGRSARDRVALNDRALLGGIFGGDDDDEPAGYAPYNVTCPSDVTWVRTADSLGTVETDYLAQRQSQIDSAWQQRTSDLDLDMPSRTPKVAMALSGGGYRAMISGSGQAFLQNTTQGSAGDVLGLTTYVGGLSGGSWAISTWMANNGAQPDYLVRNVWDIDSNLVAPSSGKISFYTDLISQVRDKNSEGFQTQITDCWSLALTDHLFPEPYRTDGNPNLTITDVRSYPALANASLPFPVIVALEREPGELVVPLNSTVWEFTLGEFGSWWWGSETKTRGGFTNVEYLGSALENGSPVAEEDCVRGFSNLGFIAGTSSTLFNQAFLRLNESNSDSLITSAIQSVLGSIGQAYNDVATYPNPFAGWQSDNNPISDLRNITLVDGGETNENIPLEPFLVSARQVDAIIAMDNSGDTTYSWPNGSSLWTSYQKGLQQAENYDIENSMPVVPSTTGFVNDGLNQRPVFFGCNETDKPLIVYLPNYPWNVYSNATTYQLEYPVDNAAAIVDNGRRTLDLNGTVSDWPTCLTCALMDRAATEGGAARSSVCQSCFDTWCWNGIDNTTERTEEYEPVLGQLPRFIQNLTGETGAEEQPFQAKNSAFESSSISFAASVVAGLSLTLALGHVAI